MSALPIEVEEAIVRGAVMQQTSAGSDDLSTAIKSLVGGQAFIHSFVPEEIRLLSRRFAEATSQLKPKTLQWDASSIYRTYTLAEPADASAVPLEPFSSIGITKFFAATERREWTTCSALQAFVRSVNDNAISLPPSQAVPASPPPDEDDDFAGVFAVDIAPRIVARYPIRVAIDSLPMREPVFSPFDPDAYDDDE